MNTFLHSLIIPFPRTDLCHKVFTVMITQYTFKKREKGLPFCSMVVIYSVMLHFYSYFKY